MAWNWCAMQVAPLRRWTIYATGVPNAMETPRFGATPFTTTKYSNLITRPLADRAGTHPAIFAGPVCRAADSAVAGLGNVSS